MAEQGKGRSTIRFIGALLLIFLLIVLVGLYLNSNVKKEQQEVRNEYFLDDQVVVVGKNLDDLPDRVTGVTLELIESISIVPESPDEPDRLLFSAALQEVDPGGCNNLLTYEINLYSLAGSQDEIEAAIEAIKAVDDDPDVDIEARAEPNWVIGTPWSPTGSPWSPTGSSTSGDPAPAIEPDYQEQWAFSKIGLYDATPANDERAPVRIGIFDTSPVKDTNSIEVEDRLDLEYQLPDFIATPVPPVTGSPEDIQVANHGYFGAGLIREIAPKSQIQLIRVLTENNRGDLFTLNRELLNFMVEASRDGIPAVINMSLGIPPLTDDVPFEFSRALESLKTIMDISECANVVTIAASGNNSAELLQPSNYPAAWDTVLGVTASNQSNEISCFANTGDVAAPGGEGAPDNNSGATCVPRLDLCPGSGPSCPYAVISHVYPGMSGDDEYHYWVGTSFSAPMVTGLAALLRQLDSSLTASEIRRHIICGANASSGPASVIRIPETFDCAGIPYN